jgi:hypothetical protein
MMSRSEGSDRRGHPRIPLHRPAVVFVGDQRLPAQAVDVSESGIGVALPGDGAAGTFVRVNFNVEDTHAGAAPWLDVDGVIVRTHAHAGGKFVWGIRFLSAPPAVVAGIKSHLAGRGTVGREAAPRVTPPPASTAARAPAPAPAPAPAAPVAAKRFVPAAASSLPRAVAAPRVASRQASDLRELYRSALDQVKAERQRAKKR